MNRREKFYKPKIGTKQGRLTIVEYAGVDHAQKHLFKVRCDCGKEKTLRWNNIRRNGNTSSCGCYKRECIRKRTAKPIDHLCAQSIKNSCSSISKNRNMEFDLDLEFVHGKIFDKCFYCGNLGSNKFTSNNLYKRECNYNGLDRKDNSKGYTKDNVVTCCSICNYMKREKNDKEFIDLCKRIAENHKDG